MTLAAARWVIGVAVVVVMAVAAVTILTSPGRNSLKLLQTEALDLAERERALLERLSALQADAAGQLNLPTELIWGQDTSKSVELALQEALVAGASGSGLKLLGFGQTAGLAKTAHPTVSFELELAGTHESLARFLAEIEAMRPALAVSYLWLRQLPPDPANPGAPVSIRLAVWGFRSEAGTP
jgi:hypothetical protein